MYCCDRCNQLRWVPFTCKSRFCPSCGNLYNMQRANALAERMFDVPHRHVIFTIPDSLRHFFLEDRSLLNVLFEAAAQTYKIVVAQGFSGSLSPGIICVLHTFSRSSDWNPHVHCLATEGGLTKWGSWRKRPYISYSNLKLTYQDILLKKLRRRIPDFASIDKALREKYPKGFNVEAAPPPKNLQGDHNLKKLIKYVARYLGRPCIGTSRIDSYDGQVVTFHYDAHIGKSGNATRRQSESLPAADFLLRLTQHIQDPHFVMVRYFGIYSTHGLNSDSVSKAFLKNNLHWLYDSASHKARLYHCHWRGAMVRIFKVDPLICPCCQNEMTPLFYVIDGKTVWKPISKRRRKRDITPTNNWGYKDD